MSHSSASPWSPLVPSHHLLNSALKPILPFVSVQLSADLSPLLQYPWIKSVFRLPLFLPNSPTASFFWFKISSDTRTVKAKITVDSCTGEFQGRLTSGICPAHWVFLNLQMYVSSIFLDYISKRWLPDPWGRYSWVVKLARGFKKD